MSTSLELPVYFSPVLILLEYISSGSPLAWTLTAVLVLLVSMLS